MSVWQEIETWNYWRGNEEWDTGRKCEHYDHIPYFKDMLILWTGKSYDHHIAPSTCYLSRLEIMLAAYPEGTQERAWEAQLHERLVFGFYYETCIKHIPIMGKDYYIYDTWEEADKTHQRIKQYLEQFAETRRLFRDVVEAMEQERLAKLKEMIEERDVCRTAYFPSILEKWNIRK